MKKMWKLLAGLMLCSSLVGLSACGDDSESEDAGNNGGTNNAANNANNNTDDNNTDPNNTDNNDPNNTDNNDPDNNDPDNNDPDNNDPDNNVNNENNPDNNVNNENNPAPTCRNVGDPCTEDTQPTDDLLCLVGGDSTDPQGASCHAICDPTLEDADCPSGSFCAQLSEDDETVGACLRSNCTSPFDSAEECAAVSANGGTCIPARNDSFYCIEAGAGDAGDPCDDEADANECGPGLSCFLGECVAYCSLDNDDAPCGDGLECLPVLTIDGLGLCGESCPGFDATDECGEGKGCFPVSADQGYCDEVGTAATGEACDEDTACAQFNICTRLNEDDPSECFAFCNRTEGLGDESCQDGEICLELNDVLGACFEGCTPFTEESGCDVAGQMNCLPIESDTRGICIDSGDVALGEECDLVDGSVLGECAAGLACNPDFDSVAPGEEPETGTCSNICRTFSEDSGCAEGEVCSIFGTEWGVCEELEIPAPLEAGEDCPESGQWCSDNTICIQVDQQGNNLCIPLCRFANGDDDCPNGTACEEVLASDALGLCIGG